MKKLLLTLSLLFIGLGIMSCTGETTSLTTAPDTTTSSQSTTFSGDPLYEGDVLVSRVVTNDQGVTYLEVDGQPFLYVGAQIRTDALMNTDHFSYDQIKTIFAKAADLGVTALQIPIEWKDIELEQDVFDFTYIYTMLGFANEYNLKIEFLWFGTNMCGDTHSYTVPDYIIRDGKTYPKFDAIRTGEFWNYYGIQWRLDFNDPDLMARESNAITKMMTAVYEYDRHNGAKHPLIGVQILNEADIFFRFRIEMYQVQTLDGQLMTYEEGMQKVYDSMNALGLAVKSSPYQVYTRANFAGSTNADSLGAGNGIYSGDEVKNPPSWAVDIFDLPGIDIVGDDTYKSNLVDIKGIIRMYSENLPGNFSHISENAGNYGNTPSLILTAIQGQGGYSIYDFITSPFFIRYGSSGVDQGITYYDEDQNIVERDHYQATKEMIEALKLLGPLAVTTTRDNFMAFNLENNYPETTADEVIQTETVIATFHTDSGALGYLVSDSDYIYVLATSTSTVTLGNVTLDTVDSGYLDASGQWVHEADATMDGQTLTLNGLVLYRIHITSVDGPLTSTTWDFVG